LNCWTMKSPLLNQIEQGSKIRFSNSKIGNRVDDILFGIYDTILPILLALAKLASLFNPKLRRTLIGKKHGYKGWHFSEQDDTPVILIHVASAGEFEGARPLIDRLLTTGKVRIAVSFSSPSAEKPVSETEGVYAYGFLPHDFLIDQLRLLDFLDPELVLIFKHDFWPNFLRGSFMLGKPVGLVNANFHRNSRRKMSIVKRFHKAFMQYLNFIWTVSEADTHRIRSLVSPNTELKVGGDTRYDRVLMRAEEGKRNFKKLSEAFDGDRVVVAGSTWEPDEKIIFQAFAKLRKIHPNIRLIVAPHEPESEALHRIKSMVDQYGLRSRLYSEFDDAQIDEEVFIIDHTRILAGLYAVGWVSYVGGGFGVGVHSVIEPAACALPVMFGPNHHVSHEAGLLIEAKGGVEVLDADMIFTIWNSWIKDANAYKVASEASLGVVTSNAGAVERLLIKVDSHLNVKLT